MSYLDEALEEVKRVTPKSGVNVCIYDDYEDVGNRLETIANLNTVEEAQKFINDYDGDAELVMYEADILEESAGKNFMSSDKNHNIPTYLEMSLQDYVSGQNRDNDEYEDTNWKKSNEFDEDKVNRHPEGSEDGKGGQFAPKDGGVGHSFSEPKKIDKEELDEDSDYRKDNPVKEDNVIRVGDPLDEEWYEKLEIGEEYTQLSHIRDYFDSKNYEQHFEGYNLFTRFDIKNKGYEDQSDKTIGQLVKLYDDNGKLIAEQRTGKDTGEFIISEKRLDENGEMKEIEYTDEEHAKNMRNFVPKYDKNYKDQRIKWDKNEKEKGKIKEFMFEGKEIEDLKKEQRSMTSEIIKLNRKVDSAENDDEIRKYQDEILEINKKSGEIGEKIKEARLDKKNDSHVQANMYDIAEIMNHINRMKDGGGDINEFSREELLSVAKSKLDDHDVKTLEKFFRMSDRVEADIKEGNIETMGKFGKNEYDEHSFVEMANSEIRNNRDLQKAEIEYKEYKTNLKSRELLYNEGDEYLENEFSFILAVVNLQDKYGLDEDTKERLRKEATPQKPVKDMNEQEKETYRKNMDTYHDYVKKEGKPTEREQKLLDDEKKYADLNKGSLIYVGENLEMHKNRIGNEVFTPLTAKNVHIYSVGDIEQDVKEHLYKKAKDFFPKNRWVKQSTDVSKHSTLKGRYRYNNVDTGRWGNRSFPKSSDVANMDAENRMHLQLNAHEGKKFKVKKGGKNLTTGGNWDKKEQTIQIFDAGSKKPNGGKRAVDWIWEHELSHSHYDYLGDAIDDGKLKDKVDAYKTFNEEAKKVDAGVIRKLMGSYASDYVVAYNNGEPKGQSVETELYAGFTDVRYQKIHDVGMQMDSWDAWRELAKTYPKLMKAFEKLSGEGVGNTALGNVFSQENIGKSSSEIHDTETIGIDIGRNIVDFDVADYIIEKGYNEIGKLVSVKTLFPENVKADEEFREEEHPRDEDGKFTSKWEISTFVGGHEIPVTQREKDNWEKHTTEEQRKDPNFKTMYGDKLKEKARGKGWDESEDVKVEKEIMEPQPPEERPQGKNYRIEAMTNKLKNHIEYMEGVLRKVEKGNKGEVYERILKMQEQLSNLESEKDVKKRVKLPNLPMGKNTHTKHTEGFVHSGKTKVKVERSFFDNDPMNKFRWELDLVQSAWNNLPDEVRDMVGNLNIKKSRASGRNPYRNGSWNDRNKTLTMNITDRSTNAETLYHEIGHARWHHMKETNPEKVDEFIAEVNKVGGAITKYAESYRNAERREMAYRRRWLPRIERTKELDPKRYEKNMKTLDARLKNVKDLYQNENHSELNSYIMGEMREDDKTNPIVVHDDRLKRLIIAYKNLWGIEN